ncbi:uncharacterized protein LOC110246499 [Exaiptasia diaphana]|uniref:DUF3598 domain-containing protein n=1 Tax=Exaiptasia diaphana TaxID=2652724 RepID=A0A913XRD3_EXADI|nr:uncharacterized protein LOC110246499 [Exaiptasia diaphana]
MDENKITPAQLWTNYTTYNCRKWLGFWTKWNPHTGEVLDSFDSIRHIQLIDDSRMKHQNTFIYKDGSSKNTGPMNGPWEYLKDRDCDEHGMIHPSSRKIGNDARAFFVQNGGGTWTIMRVKEKKIFFFELFFPDHFKRFSNGVQYDAEGNAARLTLIREDNRSRPSLYWSKEIDFRKDFDTKGEFYGTEITLSANLIQLTKTNCHWNREYWEKQHRSDANKSVVYLPDKVMTSFPARVHPSLSFHVKVFCHYTEGDQNEVREETIYFENGAFSHFKQGIYFPVDKKS